MKKDTMAHKTGLSGLPGALKGVQVLVAGDVMLDRFVYGRVDRISPESPVPVLSIAREDTMLGGAGNALANLAGLGAKGAILSVTGDDDQGRLIRDKAKALGLDISGLLTDKDRPTIVKTRYLAGHQQLLRTDFESKAPVAKNISAPLLEKAKTLLKDTKALIISDYGKGLLQKDFIGELIGLAKKAGVPVIVDPKGSDFSIYKGADVITPNRKELAEGSDGMPTETDADIVAAAEKIINSCGINAVIATRSKDGMSVIQKGKKPLHLRSRDIEVFDVSGAGDTVIATIAATLAAGASLEDAAALANIAGSIVVTKVGTAPIRLNELEAVLEEGENAFSYADKKAPLAEWDEAAEEIKRWKAKGLKVGFTNGCFDILHAGHVSYLNAARGQCERLIVGLNCDTSVKILKGANRPVHDEESRAAVLAALAAVDMVVLFGAEKDGQDNTANELLKLLKPDLYFKGGDYKSETEIPEAPVVKSFGGEIRLMPNFAGHSTTGSIKKIRTEAA
jgi:D-beta-D-heptose 7-phosphate kinase/D-beta-D-heptose 1-phosphate adenosyltransferase